jgi:two-component system response regulator HydG
LPEKILIIDDDKSYCTLLHEMLLEVNGTFDIFDTDTIEDGREVIYREAPDVIFLDLQFDKNDKGSIRLLEEISAQRGEIPIVLMSNYADMATELAEAIGAYDFMKKPPEPERLKYIVQNALRQRQLEKENAQLKQQLVDQGQWLSQKYPEIVGRSPGLLKALRDVEIVASSDATVLLTGENGTGKELFARAIHRSSLRSSRQLISRAVPEIAREGNLLELELFGRVENYPNVGDSASPGLFEKADGGTLFLDEIAGVPLEVQKRFLRTLQEKVVVRMGDPAETPISVDFRLIVATNRDLSQEVREKRFREDLFYRINVFRISIPPLRARKEDIPLLVHSFLREAVPGQPRSISGETLKKLMDYEWPGNVRQLKSAIESAVLRARYAGRERIEADDLTEEIMMETPDQGVERESTSREIYPPAAPKKCSLEEEMVLRALHKIVQEDDRWTGISTKDIRSAMRAFFPQANGFSGRKIGALLSRLGLADKRERTYLGYVYTILPEHIQTLMREYSIKT